MRVQKYTPILILLIAIAIVAVTCGYQIYHNLNSKNYFDREDGFSLAIPEVWRDIGYSVNKYRDINSNVTIVQFTLRARNDDGKMSDFIVASEITAIPIAQYPLPCGDGILCQQGAEIGRNRQYVFTTENVSPEAYGICNASSPAFDPLFVKNNKTLCASRVTTTYPDKTSGAFRAFEAAGPEIH